MDVDDLPGHPARQPVREHLHVAGQDDELDVVLVDDLEQPLSASGLVCAVTGTWWKGMP